MSLVTRDRLEQRKADLKLELDRALATINSLAGAIADVDFWLAELSKPEADSSTQD